MFFVNHVLKFKCPAKRMPYVKVDGSHLNPDAKRLIKILIHLLTNRKNVLVQQIFNNTHNDTKLIPAIPQDLVHLSDQVVHQTQVIQEVLVIQYLLSVQMDQVDLEVHQGQVHQENH
jgi:hypothetical protein